MRGSLKPAAALRCRPEPRRFILAVNTPKQFTVQRALDISIFTSYEDSLKDFTSTTTPDSGPAEELLVRLRRETSGLHRKVEEMTDLPGSVSTREDYVRLLGRLHGFHTAVEARLADSCWAAGWLDLEIALPAHRRAHLLSADLESIGAVPEKAAVRLPELDNIGQALGCLYVVEGSSLGGRVLAPAFRAVLGDVPTAFFDSDERMHPHPWRSVMAGLRRFDLTAGSADDVVLGAQETFLAFGRHLACGARVRTVVQ
jgi:heme oxygenase